jgi:hypothetical protein
LRSSSEHSGFPIDRLDAAGQWEQGRRQPSGAAETLLKIVARHPEVLREVMAT